MRIAPQSAALHLALAGSLDDPHARIDAIHENHSVVLAFFEGAFKQGFRTNFLANLADLRALLRQNFLIWLVGHEVGHAVMHRDWALRHAQSLHFDLAYDRREQEADLFVADRIGAEPALSVNFAPVLLEFVEHEFRRLYEARTGLKVDLVPRSGQPEVPLELPFDPDAALLLRAFRILSTFVERDPTAMSRAQIRPIGGRFGFAHSLKDQEYVRFVGSRLTAAPASALAALPVLPVAALLASAAAIILASLAFRSRRRGD
jgi:hypothetical protein